MLMEDFKILERWREYYQKLMNEENPREGRNEQQAVGEVDIHIVKYKGDIVTCGNIRSAKLMCHSMKL